ncbi:MAG: reactive intermediate/imine deaminase [Oceanicoccus sp.]
MSKKEIITTDTAPAAIGPYSQAIKVGDTVFLSGQIPLIPETMVLVEGGIKEQTTQVFANLSAVAIAAGGSLNDAVKINISLTNLEDFVEVNSIMAQFFSEPYPARACVQVAALPKGAAVEIEAILSL